MSALHLRILGIVGVALLTQACATAPSRLPVVAETPHQAAPAWADAVIDSPPVKEQAPSTLAEAHFDDGRPY